MYLKFYENYFLEFILTQYVNPINTIPIQININRILLFQYKVQNPQAYYISFQVY